MSSPARSTVSAASGGAVSAAEDVADSIDALYRKDETMAELKFEVMEALRRTGAYMPKQHGKLSELGQASKKTRNF
uniref:Uncharacterized protein n=2 Tax=Zea mays TaxID=4577 RepID=A0A804PCD7_MAIZE